MPCSDRSLRRFRAAALVADLGGATTIRYAWLHLAAEVAFTTFQHVSRQTGPDAFPVSVDDAALLEHADCSFPAFHRGRMMRIHVGLLVRI
jgi:hypothetical protein